LARAADAAGEDKQFLEVHHEPARARSDKGSQWPLAELEGLLQS
jgi:3-deoxy-D-manno-octulosonic acid (KDO) 8-phosphate synthase